MTKHVAKKGRLGLYFTVLSPSADCEHNNVVLDRKHAAKILSEIGILLNGLQDHVGEQDQAEYLAYLPKELARIIDGGGSFELIHKDYQINCEGVNGGV